jgi:hypothetical protein
MMPETRLEIVDTFRVDLSTILVDSIITSSKQIAYVGNYEDTIFGLITSRSFFDLKYDIFGEIEEKAIYDSAAFILNYTSKNIGDTLYPMSVSVHRMTEQIVPINLERILYNASTALFNTSSFNYEPEPMSTVVFLPEPNGRDTAVYLNVNAFGEELFSLIRSKDERVSSEDFFRNYVKGFVLTSGSVVNNAILGFAAGTEKLVDFDLSRTPLADIRENRNEVPAKLTGNKAFMQGMTGLYVKCKFPTVQNLMAGDGWKVLKAELVVEPEKFSYEKFPLPDSLYIYSGDKKNNMSMLRDGNNQHLKALFEFDDYLHENNRYTFDITDFILNELSDSYFDPNQSLILGLASTKQGARFQRLIVEGRRPPVKLKLYYLSY